MVSICAIGEQRLGVAIVSVFVGLQADADWGGVAGRYCNRFIVTERLGDSVDSSQAECRDEKQWRFCSTGLYGTVLVSGDCSGLSLCDHNHPPSTRQPSIVKAAKHRSTVCQKCLCLGEQGPGPVVRDTTVRDLSIKRNACL
jgi:hypothetical protein